MAISEPLTLEQTREALDLLSDWFEIPKPSLIWTGRVTRGRANYSRQIIKMGPRVWRGQTDCLLHEFSHLLAYRYAQRKFTNGRGHGKEFQFALHQVVAAYYGDPGKYSWDTEYKNVFAYARREGIYKPKPSMLSIILAERENSETSTTDGCLHPHTRE